MLVKFSYFDCITSIIVSNSIVNIRQELVGYKQEEIGNISYYIIIHHLDSTRYLVILVY